MKLEGEEVVFIETTQVKEGVVCDVYAFKDDDTKDLGVVKIQKGFSSPHQRVLKGDKTLQVYKSGVATLTVTRANGIEEVYEYPGAQEIVEVHVGDTMQWEADEDLVCYEICYPPYHDGRYENLANN